MATISQAHASFVPGDLGVVKEERFVFECEWYDTQASLIRKYLLTFYPKDSTAEMVSKVVLEINVLFCLVRYQKQKNVH